MFTTPNMGLTIWDQTTDDFNHSQLQINWLEVDRHDHSPGNGTQITSAGLAADSVTNAQIAPNAVGNPNLQATSVATANLQDQAVTTSKIAPGSITGNLIPDGGIAIAKLDPTILPVGAVMLWWRPPGSSATPGGGWEALDGRAWNTVDNAWNLTQGNMPDTRGVFVKGASMTGTPAPAIGATGGSATISLGHTHGVLGHTHTTPDHDHAISSDGSHIHLWQGGLHMGTRTNSFAVGLTMDDFTGRQYQNTFYSMYIMNLLSNPGWLNGNQQEIDGQADMDSAGSHSHGGVTGTGGGSSTGSATASTDSQLGSTTVDPPWVGFVYIMRVR